MTTTAVAASPKQQIQELIESNGTKISSLLPDHVHVDRFVKSALLAVARNSDLYRCTPSSVFTAVLNAAELGLDFTPAKGHAYLIPYKGEATFMPGYRGMIDLAKRSGNVRRIEAHIVHKNDTFTITYGLSPNLEHVPDLTDNPGDVVGAYAIAWFNDGETQYEFMSKKQIDGIRRRAKTDYVWKSDYEEMARKTAVRRLFKYLPCSPDLDKALEFDNQSSGIETTNSTGEAGKRTSDLADLVSGMADTSDDAEFEDIPVDPETGEVEETPPSADTEPSPDPKVETPKTKDDLIAAIIKINADSRKWPDPVLIGIASKIAGREVDDLDKLKKDELVTVWEMISDDDRSIKAANEYDASVNSDTLPGIN